jgi:hypothetical protein
LRRGLQQGSRQRELQHWHLPDHDV